MGDLICNASQFVEAVVQVACESSKHIPTKVKIFIENYAYTILVDLIEEIIEEDTKQSEKGQATRNIEGSWSLLIILGNQVVKKVNKTNTTKRSFILGIGRILLILRLKSLLHSLRTMMFIFLYLNI